MSSPPVIPRPPSRSERLLRDTLRRDDTLRTHGPHTPRSRSNSSNCDEDEDDNIFQSAILLRRSSRRNSAASVLGQGHSTGFYVPDEVEHASYSRLLRSSSYSGSSRSGRSDRRPSPSRSAYMQEKQEDLSRHHDAPHEAVLRSRLDSVIHSMGIDRHGDAVDSSTASLPSSLGSISNARTHDSHQTQLTIPDSDPCVPLASHPERSSHRSHRQTRPMSVAHVQPPSPRRAPPTPRSPRSPQGQRSPPQTPTSREKQQLKCQHPDSPWTFVPLPPSPPAFPSSPSKRAGPAVVTFVASPPMVDAHAHISTRSSRHPPNPSSAFDPDAASHALRQLPGYVSFASVAGLGAPPEEEERRGGHKPFSGFTLLGGNKSRVPGLGLGSGRWWIF